MVPRCVIVINAGGRMICRITAATLIAALLAGCGAPQSPERVVRTWSKAFNSGDNKKAARLFATGAKVIAGDSVRMLQSRDQAIAYTAGLPCSGRIVKLEAVGASVTATFELADRATHRCRGIGERGSIHFRVRDGKIVVFDQIGA
jgi:limonene-1,2-epoxide hydrolase